MTRYTALLPASLTFNPQVEWAIPAFTSPAAEHHRNLAGTHFSSRWEEEPELAWMAEVEEEVEDRTFVICVAPFRENSVVSSVQCQFISSLKRSEWHVLTRITQFYLPPTLLSTNGMSHPAFSHQPQCITALWPILISRPTEGRGWVGMGGWLHTEMVCPPEDGPKSRY